MGDIFTLVPVHVTPKAGRNEVAGVERDARGQREVRVRVTAAPDGGKANRAVIETVAKAAGVSKSSVSVSRGDTSRHKILKVRGDVSEWMLSLPDA